MKTLSGISLLLSLLLTQGYAHAEQKQVYDGYEVHYATLLTSDLNPEVARIHRIPRSGKRAYLMIHARQLLPDGSSVSVPVEIEGKVSNLLAQIRDLKWQQVKEESSIYSLSHFPVTNREWATFRINIKPEGSEKNLPLEFKQQFYTD